MLEEKRAILPVEFAKESIRNSLFAIDNQHNVKLIINESDNIYIGLFNDNL